MKINFIRQISDDILKENHDLRSNIILVKQQLQNFEDNMMAFIRQSQVEIPILATPHQTLALFMKTVGSKLADHQLQIVKHEVNCKILKQTSDELQLKNQQLNKQIVNSSNRENKWKQQFEILQKKHFDLAAKHSQFQMRQQFFKQEIKSINERNILQRNIQEELKKKQIEGVKLACHNQLRELRDRIQIQNIQLENKYKEEIQEKDKRIKQLEKLMEKLATNIKLDSSETTILSTILQAFQQSSKFRKMIDDLKQQNVSLKKIKNDLEKEKIQAQSKLMEKKIELYNLQSQYQKLKIDKLDFQKKLGAKIKQIEKSQKDKQAMEQYYDNKWSSDYNKVKSQLQKAFVQKSQEIQKVFARKIEQFEGKVVEWLQRINIYERKNKELERIQNLDANQKQNLRREIQKHLSQKKSLNNQLLETWEMTREQILTIKTIKFEEQKVYKQQIKNLTSELKKRENNIEFQAQLIKNTIKEMNQKHLIQMKKQLENQQKVFLENQSELKNSYEAKIKNLKEQVYQWKIGQQNVKEKVSKEFQKEIQGIRQRYEKQMKQKEDEAQKKLQKSALKLREYENKLASSKKQHDEILLTIEKQRTQLQKQILNLKNNLKNAENQLKNGQTDRKQLVELNDQMEKKLEDLQNIIRNKNKEIQERMFRQKEAQDKSQKLTDMRSQWLKQIEEVQKSYKKEFDQLKKNFDKQINIYKSKVWELEKQYKNQPISKKNYERILSLHSEKQELKNALDIKEAENIVLSQVKELYETQLQLSQVKLNVKQLKVPKPIFKRKIEIQRKFTEVVNDTMNDSNTEFKDIIKMKNYIKQSYKKQQHLSLAKTRYKQMNELNRVKTNPL